MSVADTLKEMEQKVADLDQAIFVASNEDRGRVPGLQAKQAEYAAVVAALKPLVEPVETKGSHLVPCENCGQPIFSPSASNPDSNSNFPLCDACAEQKAKGKKENA